MEGRIDVDQFKAFDEELHAESDEEPAVVKLVHRKTVAGVFVPPLPHIFGVRRKDRKKAKFNELGEFGEGPPWGQIGTTPIEPLKGSFEPHSAD